MVSAAQADAAIDADQRLGEVVAGVLTVQDITRDFGRPGVVRFRGDLRMETVDAQRILERGFAELGYTAFLRRDGDGTAILADPDTRTMRAPKLWVTVLMLVLTILSVAYAGVSAVSPAQHWTWREMAPGLSFAACLLIILMAHEMGHYFVARAVGIKLSLPLFIPFPFNFFGTMGAAEIMQGRPRNRRALLAVGAAGPLAGLLFAIPILAYGLSLSDVKLIPTGMPMMVEGNSLLYLGIKYLLFGRILPGGGYDVFIHPIAFAGWGGLLVTSFNLMPVGQLDGGHVLYALFGARSRWIIWPALVALIILGTQWEGWFLWAILIFLLGRGYPDPLDDITGLRWQERALGIVVLIVFVLIFIPVPMRIVGPI